MLARIADHIRLFLVCSRYMTKAYFQYRFDAFLRTLAVFLRESTAVIVVYLTLKRFDTLDGWKLNELVFLFSFLYLTYSLLVLLFTGLRDFDRMIHEGTFDRFLLRPRGLLFQTITHHTDYLASIGHGALGILLFLWSSHSVGIAWNAVNVIYALLVIAGGVLIQASVFMIFSCASFYFVKVNNLRSFLYMNTRKFAGYPLSIFPGFIQKMLVFVIPFAFVNYFPAQKFMGKSDLSWWSGLAYMTPLVGLVLFVLSCALWKMSLKRYTSTGN